MARGAVWLACGIAVFLTLTVVAQRVDLNLRNRGKPWWAPERYELTGADVVNYVRACLWIRDHTPPNCVVVCRKPYHLFLYAQRKATWGPLMLPVEASEEVWRRIRQLSAFGPVYVIEDSFGNRFGGAHTKDILAPILWAHKGSLREVLSMERPKTRVYEVVEGV